MWIHTICVFIVCLGFDVRADGECPPSCEIAAGYSVAWPDDAVSTSAWHAGLYTKNTSPYMQICGGTVVAKHVVVTAAHCITQDRYIPPASQFAVAAGKIYRSWDDPRDKETQKSDVNEIKIPPRYQGPTANYQEDIALLILSSEFYYNDYVRPACLYFDAYYERKLERKPGKVVGWGLTGENSTPSELLQAANLPSVFIEQCIEESPVSFRSSITADKICAGYNNGTAVCRGDSGGGLIVHGSMRVHNCIEFHIFLRGVVSTAPTNDRHCNVYTWATFTHVMRHEHFIKTVLPNPAEHCVPLIVSDMNENDGFTYVPDQSRPSCFPPRKTDCEPEIIFH